jgi:hypothetical protein
MHLTTKHTSIITTLAVAVLAAAGAFLLFHNQGHTASAAATPLTQADSLQRQAFSITARAAGPADVLPADAQKLISSGPGQSFGANVALSRRVGASDAAVGHWLVPAVGQICMVTAADPSEAHDGYARGSSADCVSNAQAAAGQLLRTLSGGGAYTGDVAHVTAVIPDGATNVQITRSDGSAPTELTAVSNLVDATVKSPSALEFDSAGKHLTQDLSNLPQQ